MVLSTSKLKYRLPVLRTHSVVTTGSTYSSTRMPVGIYVYSIYIQHETQKNLMFFLSFSLSLFSSPVKRESRDDEMKIKQIYMMIRSNPRGCCDTGWVPFPPTTNQTKRNGFGLKKEKKERWWESPETKQKTNTKTKNCYPSMNIIHIVTIERWSIYIHTHNTTQLPVPI